MSSANSPAPQHQGRRALLGAASSWLVLAPWALSGCGGSKDAAGKNEPPTPYAEAMRQAVGSVAGDLKGYYFRATPVGNFGVGSLYMDDVTDPNLRQVESSWFLGGPDSWLSPKLKPAERQAWMKRLVAEGTLGQLALNDGQASTMKAKVGLSLLSALAANASLNYQKGVQCSLQATEVRDRRLNWAEFESALDAGLITPAVAKVVRDNRFVVAAADLALMGYRAEFKVDEDVNPTLSATLRKNLLPAGANVKAGLQVRESSKGHFVIHSPTPVVAAMLFKRPPPRSKAFGETLPPLDAWPAAPVKPGTMDRLEGGGT